MLLMARNMVFGSNKHGKQTVLKNYSVESMPVKNLRVSPRVKKERKKEGKCVPVIRSAIGFAFKARPAPWNLYKKNQTASRKISLLSIWSQSVSHTCTAGSVAGQHKKNSYYLCVRMAYQSFCFLTAR